jgi:hypothetical protein
MEIFLNLWDEIDDFLGACRHIATSFAVEAATLARPVAAPLVALAALPLSWLFSLKNLM